MKKTITSQVANHLVLYESVLIKKQHTLIHMMRGISNIKKSKEKVGNCYYYDADQTSLIIILHVVDSNKIWDLVSFFCNTRGTHLFIIMVKYWLWRIHYELRTYSRRWTTLIKIKHDKKPIYVLSRSLVFFYLFSVLTRLECDFWIYHAIYVLLSHIKMIISRTMIQTITYKKIIIYSFYSLLFWIWR